MLDARCDIEVGIHPGPYFKEKDTSIKACSRHRSQLEEREEEFGPFDWEEVRSDNL